MILKKAHSSPLRIMSHMVKTMPCRHADTNIPVSSKTPHIVFFESSDRFSHLSTHGLVAAPSTGDPSSDSLDF